MTTVIVKSRNPNTHDVVVDVVNLRDIQVFDSVRLTDGEAREFVVSGSQVLAISEMAKTADTPEAQAPEAPPRAWWRRVFGGRKAA